MNVAANALLIVAAAVLILLRQLRPAPVEPRRLLLVPLLLGYGGLRTLDPAQLHHPMDAALLGLGLLAAAGLGVRRGSSMQVWHSDGIWMARGTRATLMLWLALIAVRAVLAAAGSLSGHPHSAGAGPLLCSLALSFAAQNLVILRRSGAFAAALPDRA